MGRPTLNESPKFRLLCRRLGIPRAHARGHLECLWDCANATGDPMIGEPAAVEAAAEWEGPEGVLFRALSEGRWIDEVSPGRWAIHDYFDHAPRYVRDRAAREAERVKKGKTITEMRSEAGKKGAEARKTSNRVANGAQLPAFDGICLANGQTPTPTPSPHTNPSPPPSPSSPPPRFSPGHLPLGGLLRRID